MEHNNGVATLAGAQGTGREQDFRKAPRHYHIHKPCHAILIPRPSLFLRSHFFAAQLQAM